MLTAALLLALWLGLYLNGVGASHASTGQFTSFCMPGAQGCEKVDEGLQEWRYRHIKLVERTIGAKKGTGGSPGVPFLQQSLFKPVFHDLWAIRLEM